MPGDEHGIPRRPRYQPLVVVATALMGGIAFDRWATLDFVWIGVASLLAIGGWGLAWRRGRHRTACNYLLAAVACAGAGWHHLRWRYFDADDISTFAREEYAPVVLEGIARESPRRVAAPPGK